MPDFMISIANGSAAVPIAEPSRFATLMTSAQQAAASASQALLSIAALQQLIVLIVAIAAGYMLSRYPVRALTRLAAERQDNAMQARFYPALARVCWAIAIVILLWISVQVFAALAQPGDGLRVAVSLFCALIFARLVMALSSNQLWSRVIAVIIWVVAALYILGWLTPLTDALDAAAVEVADVRVSLLRVITTILVVIFAFWAARLAGETAHAQLRASQSLTPSIAGLLGQLARVFFLFIAVVVALSAAGVNLTALTVLSGAIGVGIGFGLQTIFSNFISGIIILAEKSVKVGDFIELQSGVTGLVTEISIRSTKVTTNDNVDILVPNEEFIKAQVINWTLGEAKRRLRIPFGVAYGTDKELVRKAGLEAAAGLDWTYDDGARRSPQVWLVGFGDSSLDFELVVWLTDEATKRPALVNADFYWQLHSALEKYDIEIPFPQRDLHLKSPRVLSVDAGSRDEEGSG